MNLPFNTLNKDSYPYLDDSYIDKYVPVLYGKIAAVELTCVNTNFATASSSADAVFRMPDGMSDYGTAYVKVDDVWKTATVESVDYGTGLLTVSNGRSDSGSTYTCKIVDCTGYMFDSHCYPRQAMQHWYSTYGGIEYTDSNFSKTEWESELDDIRYQADFGLLLDDYNESEDSKDSYGLDYFNKVIFNISTNAGKMYARVDYTADGKITARLLDLDRTASDTIQSSELFNSGEIAGTTSGDTAYTKIIEKYYYNANDDTYLSLEDNTYEKYVKQAYKIMQSKTDESYLVYQADALVRASNLALMFKFIPIEFTVKVMGRYTARLYDVYTIALQPDNLTANTRQYAGNHDCLVTGVAPDVSNGYTTLKVQIIPDRTASTQQVAIRTDSYTTITREKTATEIVTDNLQTSIDNNLLLTGYLTVPSLSVVADKDGNVTDYSKATGTLNVKYSGTDVTGDGPVYSVVSQTGCTGTIDETTGVYAISALSADVGILTLKATYKGLSFETSFTVTKSYTGETGDDGINTATVYLYKQATSLPDVPTNTLTYTFATSALSETIDNDWLEEIPDASSTLATYRISAVAASSDTTDTITKSEWSTPIIYAKLGADGTDGANGENGTSVTISSQAVTYQSSTSGTTTPTGTWSSSVPTMTQGNYLWTRTIVTYSDSTTTTSYSVSYIAVDGTNGTDATAIDISDPEETTPEANMVYDNTYFGYYKSQLYKWTWDSGTTGYWTLTSATVPTDAVIHYSFDDMPDLPDESGATLYKDNDFTAKVRGWATNGSPVNTFTDGKWNITGDTDADGFFTNIQGIIIIYFYLTEGSVRMGSSSFTFYSEAGVYKHCEYISSSKTFKIYVNGNVNTDFTITKFYNGDGTTSQPIIDNVSGSYNATANGLTSAQGMSGKCAHFLEKQASQFDLSAYANVQSWWHSRWIYIDYTTVTTNPRFWRYGGKDYCFSNNGGSISGVVLFYTYNGSSELLLSISKSRLFSGWHHLVIQTTIASSTSATKKAYLDGALCTTATSTADFTGLKFSSESFNGGSGFSREVMNGYQDDFHFGVGEISASDVLGLYLARGNTQKLYSLADYQNRNIIVTYTISANNSAFSRSRSNVISPSTITVSAKQTKLGVLSAYSGQFIIYTTINGTSYTSVYKSSVNESSHTYTLPTTGITGLRVELYKAGGTTTLLTSTDYSTPYAEDVAPMYLELGAISTGTKSFVSATVDSDGVITPGSTISNIITGDWVLGYVSTNPKTASVYYWNGTAWIATTAQSYVSAAAWDILNLTTGGYTVTNYTVIQDAIIKNLMVAKMKLLELNGEKGVFYGGDRFNESGDEIDTTAKGFWMDTNGDIKALLLSFTGYNVLVGTDAGKYLTDGTGNEGKRNVCTGHEAGKGVSTSKYSGCTFNGCSSGYSNATGSYNNFAGANSGRSNTTGSYNNFAGASSGRSNTTGSYNNFAGASSGRSNTTGSYNACFGANTYCHSLTLDYQFNINNTKKYIEFASTATQATVYYAIVSMANETYGQISCQGYFGITAFVHGFIDRTDGATLKLYSLSQVLTATITNGDTVNAIGENLQIEVMTKRTPTNT